MRRRVLGLSVALTLALLPLLAGATSFYSVTLTVAVDGSLVVDNSQGLTSLGGVSFLTLGAAGFSPNLANPGISGPDSGFVTDALPPYSSLFVNNTADGVAIAPAGATTLLGTIQFDGSAPFAMVPGEDSFGSTFWDVHLQPIVPYSVVGGVCGDPPSCVPGYDLVFSFAVPEPAGRAGLAAVVLALLAAVVAVRQRARALCAVGAFCATLGASGPAQAVSGTVDVNVDNFGNLRVTNSLDVGLGAVDLLVTGATGFTFNPAIAGISIPDSVYSVQPLPPYDALIVNNVIGQVIAPAGAVSLLGQLQGISWATFALYPGEPALGFSLFDRNLAGIAFTRVQATSILPGEALASYTLHFVVPEPGSLPDLTALALAAAAALRDYGGRGGKIRRSSASVGAPT